MRNKRIANSQKQTIDYFVYRTNGSKIPKEIWIEKKIILVTYLDYYFKWMKNESTFKIRDISKLFIANSELWFSENQNFVFSTIRSFITHIINKTIPKNYDFERLNNDKRGIIYRKIEV